jgi:hypothetical protein
MHMPVLRLHGSTDLQLDALKFLNPAQWQTMALVKGRMV